MIQLFHRNIFIYLFTISIFLFSFESYGEEYSVFNPVPKDKLRNMTTARPSKSDSSFTIDSGHLQIETSLYSSKKTKNSDARSSSESIFNETNFRFGLTQNLEIQTILTPIIFQENVNYGNNSKTNIVGFGDTTLRLQYNIIGNDSGDVSIALIPFVKIPTNSNNISNSSVEGGISAPFDWQLKNGYSFTYNIQAMNLRRDDQYDKLELVFANMFVLGKQINEKFSGYVEYYAQQITEETDKFKQTLDFGIVYAVNRNFTLDTAINFGLSNRSDDLEILAGGAYRF